MSRLLFIIIFMISCGGKRRAPISSSHEESLTTLRARQVPFALQAQFDIHIEGPDLSASTKGAMILHQPNEFRLEIFTPVGTPLLYLVSNGEAIHAWMQRSRTFYRGDDASAVLDELLDGAVGVEDAIAILIGTLPLATTPVISSTELDNNEMQVLLQATPNIEAHVTVDTRHNIITDISFIRPIVDELRANLILMEVNYLDTMNLEGTRMPEAMTINFPAIGWKVTLDIHTWNSLGQIPDVFTLSPPPGALEEELVPTLREMAEARLESLNSALHPE